MESHSSVYKKRIRIFILLSLIAILGAFDAGVLWLAIHPQVPPLYRAYYLDHSIDENNFTHQMMKQHPEGASPSDTPDSEL